MNTGIALSKSVSIDVGIVRGTETGGKIDLRLTLFSTEFRWASVALLYKRDILDDWRSDASIISSNARFRNGNEMYGLPCSESGAESRLTWDYAANGLSSGSHCIVKAIVIPSVAVACSTDEYSRFETLFKDGDRILGVGIQGTVVGMDERGNAIVIGDHTAMLVDPDTGETVLSSGIMSHPVYAVGTSEGMIIIDANGTITELDSEGGTVRAFDASAIASGDSTLSRDDATGNLLVSGGDIPLISELAWGGTGYGTVLWSYAGPPALNFPVGGTYGDGLEVVLFCDSGSHRVVVIDRSFSPQTVTSISTLSIEGQSLAFNNPIRCVMSENVIYVCEARGRREVFGSTPSSHPAMARTGMGTQSGTDALTQFSGMCFLPLSRSIK